LEKAKYRLRTLRKFDNRLEKGKGHFDLDEEKLKEAIDRAVRAFEERLLESKKGLIYMSCEDDDEGASIILRIERRGGDNGNSKGKQDT